jgi:hypothetical protein
MTRTPPNNGLYATETTSHITKTEEIRISLNGQEIWREWYEFSYGGNYQAQLDMEPDVMSQMLAYWNADTVEDLSCTLPPYNGDDNTFLSNVAELPPDNDDNMDSVLIDLTDSGSFASLHSGASAISNTTSSEMDNPGLDPDLRSRPSSSLSPRTVHTCDLCDKSFDQEGLLK